MTAEPRLRLPAVTLMALVDRDDSAELFALTDQDAIIAWLDARGLVWDWAPLLSG